ncbi:MAG: hypothetical protein AAGG48_16265 [Planctomycetota bacterium]
MAKWIIGIACVLALTLAVSAAAIRGTIGSESDSPAIRLTHRVERGALQVTVTEQGVLESSDNTEIKCKVRGQNTVIWVIENGSQVQKGDVLCRLDTLEIEDAINERTKYAHWSQSGAENSQAQVARAKLALDEYLEGRFVTQLLTLEKDLAIAESNLRTAQNMLDHDRRMSEKNYRSQLDVEQREFALRQAKQNLQAIKTRIEVLKTYDKEIELETLNGNLKAVEATHAANVERAQLDAERRDIALEELEHCIIRADKSGLVIFPSAAAWKDTPDIAEGATVHKTQTLLLMPDLSKMQVKVGVHESVVDRVTGGLEAKVSLPDLELDGAVDSVAAVASPSGWWNGDIVKYDCIVKLPSITGLKPGMSAEVEIVIADYDDVLLIPVSSVLETESETLCWVISDGEATKRVIEIGDSNDVFLIVEDGLEAGDEVLLNPLALPEAQREARKTLKGSQSDEASNLDDGQSAIE